MASDELVWRGSTCIGRGRLATGGNPPSPSADFDAEHPIRILIVSNLFPPAHIGGYELRCAEVADRWARRGHTVRVLTSNFPGHPSASAATPQQSAVEVHRTLGIGWGPPYPSDSLVEMLRAEAADRTALSAELRRFAPDVVSLWGMEFASQPLVHALFCSNAPLHAAIEDIWLLNAFERDPLCHTREMLDALAVSIPAGLRGLLNLGCHRPDSRRIDANFSSQALARRYADGGFQCARSQVQRAGIDLAPFRDNPRWNAPIRAHGPLRVLFVGLASEQRGVLDLAAAAAAMAQRSTSQPGSAQRSPAQRGEAVELRIVGACAEPMRKRVHETCGAAGVTTRFDGPLDANGVRDAMSESDVLCAPSRLPEGLPRILMEAMAAGLPIIATNGGAQPEIVRAEFGGQLLAPGDCEALTAALLRAADNLAGLRRQAAAGRALALREFDVDHFAAQLEVALHATIERHARDRESARIQIEGVATNADDGTGAAAPVNRAARPMRGASRSEGGAMRGAGHAAKVGSCARPMFEAMPTACDPPRQVCHADTSVSQAVLRDFSLRAGRAAEAAADSAIRRADGTELWRLGVLLKRTGRAGAARRVLLALVDRFGSSGVALRRAALHLGEIALADEDYSGAARWLRACLNTTPDHARASHDLWHAESGTKPAHLVG
ncbi:MAG: glycosyltransferase [Phycisphaerales bacterium]|nr:glycosyltransferase [Phycisphaerales bacterium]